LPTKRGRNSSVPQGRKELPLLCDPFLTPTHKEAKTLHSNIKIVHQNLDYIVIYGELFGGFFPEDDLEIAERIDRDGVCQVSMDERAVQEGVYYSQDLNFIVFDVGCVMKDGDFVFLPFAEMQAALKMTKFLVIEALAVVEQFPVDFNVHFSSKLATKLNHRNVGNNLAEGVVVRPFDEIVLEPSKTNQAPTRCLVKMKNSKFSEELENMPSGNSDSLEKLKNGYKFCFAKLINHNRLRAVLSKDRGIISEDNKEDVSRALSEDAWEDFFAKFASTIHIDSWEEAQIYVFKECQKLVERHAH